MYQAAAIMRYDRRGEGAGREEIGKTIQRRGQLEKGKQHL